MQLKFEKTEALVIAPDDALPGFNQFLSNLSLTPKSSLRNLVLWQWNVTRTPFKAADRKSFLSAKKHLQTQKTGSQNKLRDDNPCLCFFNLWLLPHTLSLFKNKKKEHYRMQHVLTAAVTLLTHTNWRAHITPILKSLHWLPVHLRINFQSRATQDVG